METAKLFAFLAELNLNNHKTWFDANRGRYTALRLEFVEFLDALIAHTAKFDNSIKGASAKDAMFRINRDVRFSNNKEPYKTHFSAAIAAGGRHSNRPIYYLQLGPEASFVAGGVYFPPSEDLATIRTHILRHPKKALALMRNPALKKHFGGLDDTGVLSRSPKGFAEGPELLKYKSFTVSQTFEPFDAKDLPSELAASFKAMKPLHGWLREALGYV